MEMAEKTHNQGVQFKEGRRGYLWHFRRIQSSDLSLSAMGPTILPQESQISLRHISGKYNDSLD